MTPISTLTRRACLVGLTLALAALPAAFAQTPPAKPVQVNIQEDKTETSDRSLPLDPTVRVEYQYAGSMSFGVTGEGRRLTCGPGSADTCFKIDGQIFHPEEILRGKGGKQPGPIAQPLPPGPNKKKRQGMQTSWTRGDIKITMILEVMPGKPYEKNAGAPQKRRMDALLVKYVIENNGNKPHQVGVRMYIDTMCGNNDGAIFASPSTHPGRLLDGVAFRGKDVPDFVEMLEVQDLKNPGFKGTFTFNMGKKVEGPNRVVLTSLTAFGDWDVPAIAAGGDSAVAFFWDPKEVKAKGTREVAFGIGQSILCNPENEGKVSINFGGNFEPNKEFTVTAYVEDPVEGQSLTLELPKGMVRTAGNATQSVPMAADGGQSIVLWKGRVEELGTHAVRIRSSNGATYSRTVTISRP